MQNENVGCGGGKRGGHQGQAGRVVSWRGHWMKTSMAMAGTQWMKLARGAILRLSCLGAAGSGGADLFEGTYRAANSFRYSAKVPPRCAGGCRP